MENDSYFFKISGETPSKKNSRIVNTKTGRTFPNKRFGQWHELALVEINRQKLKLNLNDPLNNPLKATLIFIHGDKRRRDSDNGTSSILDLLNDAGILEDDNYNIIQELSIHNFYEKNNAACYICLEKKVNESDYKGLRAAIDNIYKI